MAYDKASIANRYKRCIKLNPKSEVLNLEREGNIDNKNQKDLVEKLFNDFRKYKKDLPVKFPTIKTINYELNNEAARRFLDDGKIEIDNNAAERAMRPIAVGRKNWMFDGSDNGGHTAADIYSLIENAKINNIKPHLYLQKVLATIQDYNHKKL